MISELLDQLGDCQYFPFLDIASGVHQIEINLEGIQKTAFSLGNGYYEFIRISFGFKNVSCNNSGTHFLTKGFDQKTQEDLLEN